MSHGKTRKIEDEEEDVSSYWMALNKRENRGKLKKKHKIALCAERVLVEAVGLS